MMQTWTIGWRYDIEKAVEHPIPVATIRETNVVKLKMKNHTKRQRRIAKQDSTFDNENSASRRERVSTESLMYLFVNILFSFLFCFVLFSFFFFLHVCLLGFAPRKISPMITRNKQFLCLFHRGGVLGNLAVELNRGCSLFCSVWNYSLFFKCQAPFLFFANKFTFTRQKDLSVQSQFHPHLNSQVRGHHIHTTVKCATLHIREMPFSRNIRCNKSEIFFQYVYLMEKKH